MEGCNCVLILNYSDLPLFISWFFWTTFAFCALSLHGFGFKCWISFSLFFVGCFSWFFIDSFLLFFRAYSLVVSRTYFSLILWFISSELFLFSSLFVSLDYSVLSTLELIAIQLMPMEASSLILWCNCSPNLVAIDLSSLLLNSWFLFCSGLYANVILHAIAIHQSNLVMLSSWFTVMLSAVFLVNQSYEISVLPFVSNLNAYSSSSIFLESVHFSHVFLGVGSFLLLRLDN